MVRVIIERGKHKLDVNRAESMVGKIVTIQGQIRKGDEIRL